MLSNIPCTLRPPIPDGPCSTISLRHLSLVCTYSHVYPTLPYSLHSQYSPLRDKGAFSLCSLCLSLSAISGLCFPISFVLLSSLSPLHSFSDPASPVPPAALPIKIKASPVACLYWIRHLGFVVLKANRHPRWAGYLEVSWAQLRSLIPKEMSVSFQSQ